MNDGLDRRALAFCTRFLQLLIIWRGQTAPVRMPPHEIRALRIASYVWSPPLAWLVSSPLFNLTSTRRYGSTSTSCDWIYIGDTLVYSDGSLSDYRSRVRKVLQRLQETCLQVDMDKCDFETRAVSYLGFVHKARKDQGCRTAGASPRSSKEVRGFMGFANHYHCVMVLAVLWQPTQ